MPRIKCATISNSFNSTFLFKDLTSLNSIYNQIFHDHGNITQRIQSAGRTQIPNDVIFLAVINVGYD